MRIAVLITVLIASSPCCWADEPLAAPRIRTHLLKAGITASAPLQGYVSDAELFGRLELTQRRAIGAFLTPQLSNTRLLTPSPLRALTPKYDLQSPFDLQAIQNEVHERLKKSQLSLAAMQPKLDEIQTTEGEREEMAETLRERAFVSQEKVREQLMTAQEEVHVRLLELVRKAEEDAHGRLLDMQSQLGDSTGTSIAIDAAAEDVRGRVMDTQAEVAASDLHGKLEAPPVEPLAATTLAGEGRSAPLAPTIAAAQVAWDEWYKRLAELVRQPLLSAMEKYGNPVGANTVRITVKANRRLYVTIEKSGGAEFDSAIVDAYSSISKDPGLQFPEGSLRTQVTLLTDHRHASDSPIDDVTAFTLKGDKESLFTSK